MFTNRIYDNHVEVFLFASPPREGMATGHFFRVQIKHGPHGAYMDVNANADKCRIKVALAAGAVAEKMQKNQADKQGGKMVTNKIEPDRCAKAACSLYDALLSENPVIRDNPYSILG